MYFCYGDDEFLAAFVLETDARQFCKHSHDDRAMVCRETAHDHAAVLLLVDLVHGRKMRITEY